MVSYTLCTILDHLQHTRCLRSKIMKKNADFDKKRLFLQYFSPVFATFSWLLTSKRWKPLPVFLINGFLQVIHHSGPFTAHKVLEKQNNDEKRQSWQKRLFLQCFHPFLPLFPDFCWKLLSGFLINGFIHFIHHSRPFTAHQVLEKQNNDEKRRSWQKRLFLQCFSPVFATFSWLLTSKMVKTPPCFPY